MSDEEVPEFQTPEESEMYRQNLINEVFKGTSAVLNNCLLCDFLIFARKKKLNYFATEGEDALTDEYHEDMTVVSNMTTDDLRIAMAMLNKEIETRKGDKPLSGAKPHLDA